MPRQKLKSENYQNLGGINSKISPYNLGPQEFLDLTNYDFQTPGSLSQAWGSTHSVAGGSLPQGRVTGLFEFEKTTGFSSVIIGTSGALWQWAGATVLGVTTGTSGATFVEQVEIADIFWDPTNGFISRKGAMFWGNDPENIVDPDAQDVAGTLTIAPIQFGGGNVDSAIFQNSAYIADGANYFRFDGSSVFRLGMPYAFMPWNTWNMAGSTVFHFDRSKQYAIATSFTNSLGEEGPLVPTAKLVLSGASFTTYRFFSDWIVPPNYDITKINFYVAEGSTIGDWGNAVDSVWNTNYYFYKSASVSAGATRVSVSVGVAADPSTFNQGTPRNVLATESIGFTLTGNSGGVRGFQYTSLAPSMVEQWQNRVFIGGLPSLPSSFIFSNLGLPNVFDPEAVIEVRTNDGDKLTAIKAYGQRLLIGKGRSIHQLTGDNEDNFVLSEISSEYGVVNNRCVVTYGDLSAFLDTKGLIGYNSAALSILSFKIQPLIDRINQAAAVTHACVVHDKLRNQLMIGVPLDGATINNTTLVYDYVANAWTKYAGFNPSVFAVIGGPLGNKTVFYGGYTGTVSHFGSTYMSYAGSGMTVSFKSRFLSELGNSVEKQWRRLYLNVDDTAGVTMPLTVNFYKNYGSTVALTRTMYSTPFQSRIDFGISAKSLAVEVHKSSTTQAIKVHGYSFDYRYQRAE